MVLTLHDGCICHGHITGRSRNEIPVWLHYNAEHPDFHMVFIRMNKSHFVATLNLPHVLFTHDPANHNPMNVQMNIENGQYYSANSFQAYNVSQHNHHDGNEYFPGDFPLDNHIYVAVPEDKVYSAVLQHQPYHRDNDRQSNLLPGVSSVRQNIF